MRVVSAGVVLCVGFGVAGCSMSYQLESYFADKTPTGSVSVKPAAMPADRDLAYAKAAAQEVLRKGEKEAERAETQKALQEQGVYADQLTQALKALDARLAALDPARLAVALDAMGLSPFELGDRVDQFNTALMTSFRRARPLGPEVGPLLEVLAAAGVNAAGGAAWRAP